jgi:hypothetical protein
MFRTNVKVCQYFSYDRLRTAMARDTEAVDVYSILKPVFFVPKILGLSPYNAVGDIGDRRIIVTVSAVIYSIGMLIFSAALIAYGIRTAIYEDTWENICNSAESIMALLTLCLALCGYFTCLFGCRQTARLITRLNDLIGKTYYSAWMRDLQLLLAIQILCVIMTVTAGVLEVSEQIRQFQMSLQVLDFTIYYITDLVGFMSEHQFVVFMHVLKRTVQNWNNHIDDVCENDDVFNSPLYRKEMSGQKSVIFVVPHNSATSKRERIYSKLMELKQFRELHASTCDIAESVNAIYSPMLLLSVAKFLISITHMMYYIIVNFIVQKTTFFCKLTGNDSYFVWLILYLLRLIWMVHFTAFAAKEVSHNV